MQTYSTSSKIFGTGLSKILSPSPEFLVFLVFLILSFMLQASNTIFEYLNHSCHGPLIVYTFIQQYEHNTTNTEIPFSTMHFMCDWRYSTGGFLIHLTKSPPKLSVKDWILLLFISLYVFSICFHIQQSWYHYLSIISWYFLCKQ